MAEWCDNGESKETVMPKVKHERVEYRTYHATTIANGTVRYFKAGKPIKAAAVSPSVMKILTRRLEAHNKPQPERGPDGKITKGKAQDTNKNGTAGAPTKYEDRYCDELVLYFDVEKYKDITVEKYTRFNKDGEVASETEKYKRVANDLPTFESFAKKLGVHYSSLREWATTKVNPDAKEGEPDYGKLLHPEFSEAYNVAKALQKDFLIQNGLHGHYPPASFIFVAKNITDMTDTQVIQNEDKADLKKKKDALSDWFDTLQHDAQSTHGNPAADAGAVPDIQT